MTTLVAHDHAETVAPLAEINCGGRQDFTMLSSPALLVITSVNPLASCQNCLLLNLANNRVTVSREAPIILAISSCVKVCVSLISRFPSS
jgi:hypothetical protein